MQPPPSLFPISGSRKPHLIPSALAPIVSYSRKRSRGAAVTEKKLEESEFDASPLSQLLETNTEAVDTLKSLLQKKLQVGEDSEALSILKRLVAAQPSQLDWKFLLGRLLNEMGQAAQAQVVFEEILAVNPLSFEALFENAVLMDQCGEGEAVIPASREGVEACDIGGEREGGAGRMSDHGADSVSAEERGGGAEKLPEAVGGGSGGFPALRGSDLQPLGSEQGGKREI